MIYIKSNEHNLTNNYNDKVKMILRSRLEANIKYVVTTSYSAIKMGLHRQNEQWPPRHGVSTGRRCAQTTMLNIGTVAWTIKPVVDSCNSTCLYRCYTGKPHYCRYRSSWCTNGSSSDACTYITSTLFCVAIVLCMPQAYDMSHNGI